MADTRELEKFLRSIADKIKDKKVMRELGEQMKEDVVKRTRLGYGVAAPQGEKQKLAPLTPKYIVQRRRLRKAGKLSTKTQPAKSNLTLTGHMLDSVKLIADEGSVRLEFGDSFAEKKAEWVSKKRPFWILTKQEYKRALEFLRDRVRELLQK